MNILFFNDMFVDQGKYIIFTRTSWETYFPKTNHEVIMKEEK